MWWGGAAIRSACAAMTERLQSNGVRQRRSRAKETPPPMKAKSERTTSEDSADGSQERLRCHDGALAEQWGTTRQVKSERNTSADGSQERTKHLCQVKSKSTLPMEVKSKRNTASCIGTFSPICHGTLCMAFTPGPRLLHAHYTCVSSNISATSSLGVPLASGSLRDCRLSS